MPALNKSAVRARAHKHGKRVAPVFVHMLDKHVERIIDRACAVHNGGKITLDSAVGEFIGLNR